MQRRCELHPPEDGFQTNGDTMCRCYRLSRTPPPPPHGPATRAPTTRAPTNGMRHPTTRAPSHGSATDAPVHPPVRAPTVHPVAPWTELTPQGCCRNSHGSSATLPYGHIFGASLVYCQQMCENRPECGAVEFIAMQRRCELHPPEDGFQTNGDTMCRCYRLHRTGSTTRRPTTRHPTTRHPTRRPTRNPTLPPTQPPTRGPTLPPTQPPTTLPPTQPPTDADFTGSGQGPP